MTTKPSMYSTLKADDSPIQTHATVSSSGVNLPARFDEKMLSEWWGVSVKTLQNWRSMGEGPKYIKFRNGIVRYRREEILAYESCFLRDPHKI
jgi:hypothetical protein